MIAASLLVLSNPNAVGAVHALVCAERALGVEGDEAVGMLRRLNRTLCALGRGAIERYVALRA